MTSPLAMPPQVEPTEEPEHEIEQADLYGENNRDLPQQLIDGLKSAIKEFSEQEKYTRRREVLHDRRNRFYERGYQHISWSFNQAGFTIGSPGAYITNSAGQSVQMPSYIDDYDIFGPYLWILIAILTQNPPGVNFQPIDPNISEDIDKSKMAECYARMFDRMNDTKQIQTDIVRMMGTSGRTVSWTRTETDCQKFGYEKDGVTPKAFQYTTIHGTLETKVPILARELNKDFLYCMIFDDPDVKVCKDLYDWVADKMRPNMAAIGENMYERTARLGVLNGTRNQAQIGDSFSHLCSRVNVFMRPACFTGKFYDNPLAEPDDGDTNDDGSVMTLGEKLRAMFKDGVRAVFVGDQYVESYPESLDDHIDIRFPFPGDGQFRKAIMDPMVVPQDAFNDAMNAAREVFDTGWPSTWTDADEDEYDAISSQRSAPYAIRQKKARTGMKLGDSFYREADPQLPASFEHYIQMLQGELPQFQLAAPPALFGAAMEDQKTASGYAQARSQAMGRLGLVWQSIQHMFARIRYQSALAASRNMEGEQSMTIPGGAGEQNITVDMEKLRKGNFGCYPDEDSSFPESTQQKRAILQGLVTMAGQSPMMMQLLDNPDNIEELKRLNGFEELTLLPAEARNKQLYEIQKLLEQAPIPPSPDEIAMAQVQGVMAARQAELAGMPPPPPPPPPQPKSSIPVDELDYHQWEFEKCQEWLSSAARRAEDQRNNQAGVENVKLHAMEHKAAMAAMMPPPPPPPVRAPKPGPPLNTQAAPVAPAAPPALPI